MDIQPPLMLTEGSIMGLKLDFNLPESVGTDLSGHLTGAVNPSLEASLEKLPTLPSSPVGSPLFSGVTVLELQGLVTGGTNPTNPPLAA